MMFRFAAMAFVAFLMFALYDSFAYGGARVKALLGQHDVSVRVVEEPAPAE